MKKTTAITISMNRTNSAVDGEQRMTSMEIAELTGKQHKHVMEAIRKMEPAWENVQGSKFRLSQKKLRITDRRNEVDPLLLADEEPLRHHRKGQ